MLQKEGFILAGGFVSAKNMIFKPAILIPVYNHEKAIGVILKEVLSNEYPVLLVDDGSDAECRDVLINLQNQYAERVMLIRLEINSGKGAAVKAGFKELHQLGYSHALQIDADGQHDLSDLLSFIASGKTNPEALITGYPKFDKSIPKARYYSRYLTHVWVWINTLSFDIKDTMCGFRLYPLTALANMIEHESCGDRMSFDTEVMVRWHWLGGQIVNIPTKVNYPIDGISHFDVWQDNVNITKMHATLFFGMLKRLPQIVGRKLRG